MGPISQFSKFPLGFGGASISGEGGGYGFGPMEESKAIELLHEAFDLGFRLFDSAPIYGYGLSEKRMGLAFRSMREKVFLVSKSGVTWHENKRVDMNNDPLVTERMLHQSLKDFHTDYIDLYMIHWPDHRVDIRRPLEVLAKAKHQGKIRHIGLSNTHYEDLTKALEIEKVEVIQTEINIFNPRFFSSHSEDEQTGGRFDFPIDGQQKKLNALIKSMNIELMSWGTLEKGIISGTVNEKRTFDETDCRRHAPWWKAMDFQSRYALMNELTPLLLKEGLKGIDLALAFNLHPHYMNPLTIALVGPRNREQLQGLVHSLKNPLLTGNNADLMNECFARILHHHKINSEQKHEN